MRYYKLPAALFLVLSCAVGAQTDTAEVRSLDSYPQDQIQRDQNGNRFYYDRTQRATIYEINNETVVVMDEIQLHAKPKFNNQLDRNYYYFLNKKLGRVYPLFLQALAQYRQISAEMASMGRSESRKLIREKQNLLADQYEKQLRDLTTTEGNVFVKLMNRATGKTVFDIIKELRGGWSAFWWNVKGDIADVDLKQEFDPHKNRTDEFLESLLRTNIDAGYIQPYPGYETYRRKK